MIFSGEIQLHRKYNTKNIKIKMFKREIVLDTKCVLLPVEKE